MTVLRSGVIAALSCGVLVTALACSERRQFPSDVTLVGDSGTPDGPTSCVHCSRDLKQVLDGCDGDDTAKVVETCSDDRACGGNTCVDPCAAAAMNQGSAGCEFWTQPPSASVGEGVKNPRGSCFAATIANTWERAVNISMELRGVPLDISQSIYRARLEGEDTVYEPIKGPLPPGEVALVFLSHVPSGERIYCPPSVKPAVLFDPIQHDTTINDAFHIKTDAPVSAYSIFPYGGATSYEPAATLLLPVSAWSKNYLAIDPELEDTKLFANVPVTATKESLRTLQIVASEDDTEVSIKPTVDLHANGDVAGTPAGATQTWTLSKGQVLQFVQGSMTGSPIESTKPVGVFGGAQCTFIPNGVRFCDMLQQQIPSLEQWGSEYAVVPHPPRRANSADAPQPELVPYTIVGSADGTELTYDPARPVGAPLSLRAGEIVSFATREPFLVRSQDSRHAFHVNVYMTGSQLGRYTGAGSTLGDPEWVNVPATGQFLDRYVFFTDFTYPDTGLTVVRRKNAGGFSPVELSCGGEITGWKPLGTSGTYEYAWVDLTTSFTTPLAKGGCSGYGRQEARSDGAFAITVWGLGRDASYGYVGGTGLRPINDAVPVPIK